MMRQLSRTLPALLLSAALFAQEPKLDARSFLPQNYQAEFFADLEAMRECEFLDGLERSVAFRMLKSLLRNETGIDLGNVQRVKIASQDRGRDAEARIERVTILEGAPGLCLPEPTDTRERGEIAGHGVLCEQGFAADSIWVSPQPGLLVIGSRTVVESTLKGERRGGVPHPDLMAVIAVRKPLLHFAAARSGMEYEQWVRLMGFPEDWVTADDPVDTAVLRLELVEDKMMVTAQLRFAKGTQGPKLFASRVREALARVASEPAMAAASKTLEKLVLEEIDGGLELKLDLGSPRVASTQVAQMLTPMAFMVGTAEAPAPVAAPVPVPVEAEAEAEAPGKGKAGEKKEQQEKK